MIVWPRDGGQLGRQVQEGARHRPGPPESLRVGLRIVKLRAKNGGLRQENEFLKKNSRLACEGTSVNDRYEVGTAKKAIIPSPRCAGVSRFGYYSGRDRPGSITKVRRQELRIMIKDVFEDS